MSKAFSSSIEIIKLFLSFNFLFSSFHFKESFHAVVKVSQVQNLGEARRLETQKKVAVLFQSQSPGESGRDSIADEIFG